MIAIEQLRYVRLGTTDLAAAVDFAQRVMGLELVERNETQASFKSDFRDHTLVFFRGEPTDQAVAFEIRHVEMLDQAASALAALGVELRRGTAAEIETRRVKDFGWFKDASGNRIELVCRPLNSGWRYHGARDAGITGLAAVALRTTDTAADQTIWTTVFNGRISDWVGDAAFIRFDQSHHRLALYPAQSAGVLAVEYAVEDIDFVMQAQYSLQGMQVRLLHGPGRRPTSEQAFVTFAGPTGVAFSYVTQATTIGDEESHRPRQFARTPRSFCTWGSDSSLPETK